MDTGGTVWSFDLGKASIGEAVRDTRTHEFLHKASLLIPAEFASTKDAAKRRRAWRTRQAHKAREAWLDEVWRAAGLEPLQKREVWKNPENKEWGLKHHADERLEREFPAKGDATCFTSCLLRIKLLRSEKLEPWQIYKALYSAIQKRGYGRVPWAARESKRSGKTEEEVEKELQKKDPAYRAAVEAWPAFKRSVNDEEFHFPCYYDAWKMGLWAPEKSESLEIRINHSACSTHKVRFDRVDVENEIAALARNAAVQLPALAEMFERVKQEGWMSSYKQNKRAKIFRVIAADIGAFIVHGPAGEPLDEAQDDFTSYLSYRAKNGIHSGSVDDWMGATAQKTPRFDNRIVSSCALIPRLKVCNVAVRFDKKRGWVYPESLLASEVTFLMKLKNTLVYDGLIQRKLTPNEVRAIFKAVSDEALSVKPQEKNAEKKIIERFALKKSDWAKAKDIKELKLRPVTNHEEVKSPKPEGRSRFSRPALRLVRALILSGQKPSEFLRRLKEHESALILEIDMDVLNELLPSRPKINGKAQPQRRSYVLTGDLKFLADLAHVNDTWEDLHFPEQHLDALEERHTNDGQLDRDGAIHELLGSINDPVVRHRLGVFSDRLIKFQRGCKEENIRAFGVPQEVVIEFVREDFMGEQAKSDLQKFNNERERARKEAKERAAELGVNERSGQLKYELMKEQSNDCPYCQQPFCPTELASYRIEHIVPRKQGGPDARVNYVLAHEACNDMKGKLTPFQWKHGKEGWDAYETWVKRHATALRNKKVQLLLREDAHELVQRYTALAETAWISRLAQKIVSLHFGWRNGNDFAGEKPIKRITIISGGLTARIRRKYRLNSLLSPCPQGHDPLEWESKAEKNRGDERHHALDAMVINFLPQWARDAEKEHFFRFPEAVHKNAKSFFQREIDSVIPRRIVREFPVMEETIYGKRHLFNADYIVKRRLLFDLATKEEKGKVKIKPHKDVKTQKIVDGAVRRIVEAFLETQDDLTLETWSAFCAQARRGANGPRIVQILMTESEPNATQEYGNFGKAKDAARGEYRRAASHAGYFIIKLPAPTKKEPDKRKIEVRPVFAFQSEKAVESRLLAEHGIEIVDYFWSNCQVTTVKEWEFKGEKYPPGEYTLKTLWAQGNAILKHGARGLIGAKPKHNAPIGIRTLVEAGIKRRKV